MLLAVEYFKRKLTQLVSQGGKDIGKQQCDVMLIGLTI